MSLIRKVFDYKGSPILVTAFAVLFIVEGRRQLRKRKQPRMVRAFTNMMVSLPAFTLLRLLFLPIMVKLAKKNQQAKWGINYWYDAPPFAKAVVSFLIMDYTNYLWHVLNHRLPLLWRFHLVHHSDPDLDLTTALRFHFGEIIGSIFYRGTFVFVSGASPINVLLYEIIFEGATQFHHSNTRLPIHTERALNKIIVTPRMHGIHHSMIRDEADSNYSVIFSWWDRMHRTLQLNIKQDKIITGVPHYEHADELTVGQLLKLPFSAIRAWNKEDDRGEADRKSGGRTYMAY